SQLSHERGNLTATAVALRGISDSDPMGADVRLAEGDAWLKLRRASLAEDCWLRANRLAPDNPIPRRRLIYLYAMQLRREPWTKLLWELYDRHDAGLTEMIQLMIADHVVWDPEESITEMRAYAAADILDIHSRRALAWYLLTAGKIDEAIEELDS